MLYKKLMLAFVLLLNHSMMFGVTEAAHIPDEDHPQGYAFHTQDHDHNDVHGFEQLFQHHVDPADSEGELSSHDGHDHHHKHGSHIHLNCELPYSLQFDFKNPGSQVPPGRHVLHQSLSYSPPVPPPNK